MSIEARMNRLIPEQAKRFLSRQKRELLAWSEEYDPAGSTLIVRNTRTRESLRTFEPNWKTLDH
jgi:hypothetical protein